MDSRSLANSSILKSEKKFVQLFGAPEKINIADKPPRLGGKVTPVSTSEFAKQSNMTAWTESIVLESDASHQIKNKFYIGETFSPSSVQKIINQIKINTGKQAICYMNEQVGHGVFALEDMPKGTWVAMYAGYALPVSEQHPIETHNNIYAVAIPGISGNMIGTVNAEKYGNIARFYQHLPQTANQSTSTNDITLDDYQFSGINKHDVAAANLEEVLISYQGYPVAFFRTSRDVKKDEQLGWDYGRKYWPALDIVPCLFDKKGTPINPSLYLPNKVLLRVCENVKRKRHADLFIPLKDFYQDFRNGPIKIDAEKIIFTITQADFDQAFEKYKHSPFIIIDKPSHVEQVALQDQTTSIGSGLKFGFHKEDKSEIIREELNRITGLLGLPKWGYNKAKNIAFLAAEHVESEGVIRDLAAYLESKGLKIKVGHHKETNKPLIYVENADKLLSPSIEYIEEMKPLLNQTLKSLIPNNQRQFGAPPG